MDLSSLSLKDLTLLQSTQLGDNVVMNTKTYSYPRTDLDYVVVGDVDGVNYVSGSEGQVKTIKEYLYDGATYTLKSTSTLYYSIVALPTKVTRIDVVGV